MIILFFYFSFFFFFLYYLITDIQLINELFYSTFLKGGSYKFVTNKLTLFIYILFVSLTPALYISNHQFNYKHIVYMLVIYVVSILFLYSNNLFFFLFFYELLILPIFFILREFGHYYRRVQASFFILIWALIGSIFLFLGSIIFINYSNIILTYSHGFKSFWLLLASNLIIFGFLVKVPMWPFHYWISRAHAEGPTNLSIFLSGVLVKLSIFGIFRILDFSAIKLNFFLFFFLSIVGVCDSTLKMLIQIDSKVVVAFSTTVQMNFILFIIFSMTASTNVGVSLACINHMLTASILFTITDVILVRFNTREFFFLTGLFQKLPLVSVIILFSLINQINFPGFLGFILDIVFIYSEFVLYPITTFILFFFLFVIEHLYIFFFFLKITFGSSIVFNKVSLKDATFTELFIFFYLLMVSIIWGIFPFSFFFIF